MVQMGNRFMSRLSIELVPRDAASLEAELTFLKDTFSSVRTINIPDLARFPLRSWEGCAMARKLFPHAIPHIRARDVNPDQPLSMTESLRANGITEVLVVNGDGAVPEQRWDPELTLAVIARFKAELPDIKVYAALDQYRTGMRQELRYAERKVAAGADGFFTQPFFDFRLMELYAELFKGREIFWGVTPVVSERSQAYWENRNNVVFPKGFSATLGWNRDFASQALTFARKNKGHVYFMPIKVDLGQYLKGIIA